MSQPQVESRDERPYAAIQATISTMSEFRAAADSGFPELFGWLETRGIDVDGPPFIRYVELGADGQPRVIELGVPLSAPAPSSDGIRSDSLPAGRYATLVHVGPYASDDVPDLGAARSRLISFIQGRDLAIDRTPLGRGSRYGACLESYLTNARLEPDPSHWRTELAYLLTENG